MAEGIDAVAQGFSQGVANADATATTSMKWASSMSELQMRQANLQAQQQKMEETKRDHNIQVGKVLLPMVSDIAQEQFDGPRSAKIKAFNAAAQQMGVDPSNFLPYLKDNEARPQIGQLLATIMDPKTPMDAKAKAYEMAGPVIGSKNAMTALQTGARNAAMLASSESRGNSIADPKKQQIAEGFSKAITSDPIMVLTARQSSGLSKFDTTKQHIDNGTIIPSVETVKEMSADIATIATQATQVSLGAQERNDWISSASKIAAEVYKIANIQGNEQVGTAIARLTQMREAMAQSIADVQKNRELELLQKRIPIGKNNEYIQGQIEQGAAKYGMTVDDLKAWKPAMLGKDLVSKFKAIRGGDASSDSGDNTPAPKMQSKPLDAQADAVLQQAAKKGMSRAKVEKAIGKPLPDDVAAKYGFK